MPGRIQYLITELVPEPSSFVLAALGLIGLVVWRRRIAALHIRFDSLGRSGKSTEQNVAEREELKRQIAALTKQMMAP